MKLKLTLIGLLLGGCVFTSFAGPKDNYGTDACTQLVVRANALYEKGKYADAKVLYEQALATGDSYYTKKCTTQLRIINNLLGNQRPATKATVFTISQDTVKINYLGGDYPVHVDGTNWKAMTPGNEDWCKIEVDQKRGTVKIFCSKNESVNDRSTFVTITNGNGKKKTVAVINEGSPEILRSSAQNLVFTPDGETSVVDIDANTDWNIAGVPGWLQAIKGVGDIQFTAKPNDENKDRIAQVKVETPSKQEITINIIQGATLDSLAFNKNNLQFGPEGGDEYIHVLTNADDWRFGDFPHWCQLERVNNNTIRVHCTPNEPVDMPREASVNVTTGTQTLGINVFQAPKPIVHIIPTDGVGGRRLSFGFSAGYVNPMIGTSASSKRILSPVNYMQGPDAKSADYTSSGGFNIGAFADLCLYKNLYLIAGLDFIYYKYKNEFSESMKIILPQTSKYYLKGEGEGSFKEEYTMMNLEIPILASYRIPINKKSHFRINVGPVIDFGLSSKLNLSGRTNGETFYRYKILNGNKTNERYDNYTYESHLNYSGLFNLYSGKANSEITNAYNDAGVNIPKYTVDEVSPLNRINFGLRCGIGYEYMGISISAHYQFMISNMANQSFWDDNRWTIFRGNDEYRMRGYSQRNNLLLITLGYTFRY